MNFSTRDILFFWRSLKFNVIFKLGIICAGILSFVHSMVIFFNRYGTTLKQQWLLLATEALTCAGNNFSHL